MNAVVKKYAKGKPVEERLRLQGLWDSIEKKYRNDDDPRGVLPCFGQTALEFVRVMEKDRGPARKDGSSFRPVKKSKSR